MVDRSKILDIIRLIKDFNLDEAELKLGEAYNEYVEQNFDAFIIMCKCFMAYIKGEQHNTVEKYNIIDYLFIQYGDAIYIHMQHAIQGLDDDPLCRLMLGCLYMRKGKITDAIAIMNDIEDKLSGNLLVFMMLMRTDAELAASPRNHVMEITKMYCTVALKARQIQYHRIEFLSMVRIAATLGTLQNTMLSYCERLLLTALQYFSYYNEASVIATIHLNLGVVYYLMKNYVATEHHLNTAIKQYNLTNTPKTSKEYQMCLYKLACAHLAQKKHSMAYILFVDLLHGKVLGPKTLEHIKSLVADCHPNKRIRLADQ